MIKRLALTVLLLALPSASFAAIAKVQCVDGLYSTGATFSVNITATTGNLLWVNSYIFGAPIASTINTATDGGTNTYTSLDSLNQGSGGTIFAERDFYAKNITGGTLTVTITANQTLTGASGVVSVCEFSGLDTVTPLDVHNAVYQTPSPGAGTNNVTSPSVTTTANGDLVVGGAVPLPGGETWAAGTGFSLLITTGDYNEFQIQGSAGAIAATMTASGSPGSNTYLVNVAAFKAAGAAVATGNRLMLLGVGK